MRQRWMRTALACAGIGVLGSCLAAAQTDVGASLYGAFSESTSGGGTVQSPANGAGGMIELRHISHPLVGFEATYSYNRANQRYFEPVSCGEICNTQPAQSVSANAHEITADYVASLKIANLRPFALAGGGVLFHQPSSGQSDTNSATSAVFVYGAGLDWGLLPHFGLRLQYRGNLYKAPDLTKVFTSTDAFTHTAEPMVGLYLRL